MSGEPTLPEARASYEAGLRQTELNTILARISRRADGEPTQRERKRISVLKNEITTLKRGKTV